MGILVSSVPLWAVVWVRGLVVSLRMSEPRVVVDQNDQSEVCDGRQEGHRIAWQPYTTKQEKTVIILLICGTPIRRVV